MCSSDLMFKKLKKLVVRWFIPSAEQMTDVAVETVATFVNSSDKQETIAKYSAYVNEFTKVQSAVARWLLDGKISDDEKEELKRALLPLAQKIVETMK